MAEHTSTGDTRRLTLERSRFWRPWPTFAASSDPNLTSPNFLLVAAYCRLLPKREIPGTEIKRAAERMRVAGIPAVRDEAEDQYYILDLCLTRRSGPSSSLSSAASASSA